MKNWLDIVAYAFVSHTWEAGGVRGHHGLHGDVQTSQDYSEILFQQKQAKQQQKKCKIVSLLEDLGNLRHAEEKTTQYMKEKLILYFI